jgi:hypothetical protein
MRSDGEEVRVDEVPERHRRALRALREGGPSAPPALHRRVEATVGRQTAPRRSRLRWRLPMLAAAAAALALALVVALTSLSGGSPSVAAVAELSDRTPTESQPAVDPARPALLEREFEGVAFPNWAKIDWRPVGASTEEIDGRATASVYYTHEAHRISYTVIAGDPVEPPADATTIRVGGVELQHFRRGPRDVVMFERNGRTCVVAGHFQSHHTAYDLAAWRGDGAVRF